MIKLKYTEIVSLLEDNIYQLNVALNKEILVCFKTKSSEFTNKFEVAILCDICTTLELIH